MDGYDLAQCIRAAESNPPHRESPYWGQTLVSAAA
jgi:hypothetical protein